MIPPDTVLHIYEIRGDQRVELRDPPLSFIGLWNEEEISYLFFTQPEHDYVNSRICAREGAFASVHSIPYKDWQTGLPDGGVVAGGIHFVAADQTNPPANALVLDPSVVFGDGSHPTTVSCLRAMEKIIRATTTCSLLDLGTGSGILAMAAARMGIRHILAVDKNRLAVKTARRNVELNGLAALIRVEEAEARTMIGKPFDMVTANLPFQILRDLSTLEGANLHKFWIVSGVNQQQGELLKELFSDQGFSLLQEYADPPWVSFVVMNKNPGR
jgi:ribosomal protein L11 methyltransferase